MSTAPKMKSAAEYAALADHYSREAVKALRPGNGNHDYVLYCNLAQVNATLATAAAFAYAGDMASDIGPAIKDLARSMPV